jgi:hypothetical protein
MGSRRRLSRLVVTFLFGILPACGLAGGPSLISRPETPSSTPGVAAYYDGNPQSVTIRDAAIAFAIASGITQPSQIVSFVNTVLRVQPPLTLAEVTTANPNPVAISDFDGDGTPGTVRDAAILFAVATLQTRDANRINTFVNTVLRLQPPLNLTPEQAARLPGPGFVPPTGLPTASPSPSPPGIPTLGVPQAVTGRLTTSSPRDPRRPTHFIQDFLLSAPAGQTVRIQLSSIDFDTYLFIVNQATGEVIAETTTLGGVRIPSSTWLCKLESTTWCGLAVTTLVLRVLSSLGLLWLPRHPLLLPRLRPLPLLAASTSRLNSSTTASALPSATSFCKRPGAGSRSSPGICLM